ncbi:dephospho-CoA kinase [Tuanshanicoccus lijuaniae]|uniref:dephospho-CoA kinase n=1 Tax=Aerococcaceae bacterium zg-1292 TaxID=2774330 RepID=UPI001935468A|nr:dephospho-CoA kinase [Aerococcaceae bacterium zg-1292]QQA37398.1 dephospho-CoA kinase [Aerococcaceae bacterium zg-1292]
MKVIGLTGGIATGKSTVVRYIINRGYKVIDADTVAREVVEVGQPALADLVHVFGESILTQEGALHRKRLGKLMFSDVTTRQTVNAILHPYIFDSIRIQREQSQDKVLFIDMPLLFEVGYEQQVDEVWLVYVPHSIQLTRLMKRDGLSEEEAQQRIKAQWPVERKRAFANLTIDNSGTIDATYRQVEQALARL